MLHTSGRNFFSSVVVSALKGKRKGNPPSSPTPQMLSTIEKGINFLNFVYLFTLNGHYTLDWFSSICTKGTKFMTFCLLSCTPSPFWKGDYSKRKEFAPRRSKFFPFRIDPFSEGRQNNFDRVTSPENDSVPLNSGYVSCGMYYNS